MSHAVIHADALTYLRGNRWLVQNGYLPRAHAVLCDPPYGLEFMGKEWDKPKPSGSRIRDPKGGRGVDGWGRAKLSRPDAYIAGEDFQAWVTEWAGLLIDYAYPGALGLFFGGTRTYHRLATGLEDAGWEISDSMCVWVHAQGFPKSASIGKLLDKEAGAEREVVGHRPIAYPDSDTWGIPNNSGTDNQGMFGLGAVDIGGTRPITTPATPLAARWEGYGTALKPSWESVVVARAPRGKRTYAALAREFGTGALNVDGSRIGTSVDDPNVRVNTSIDRNGGVWGNGAQTHRAPTLQQGRWPANFGLICTCDGDEHDADCPVRVLGEQSGELTSGKREPSARTNHDTGWHMGTNGNDASVGTAARFFYQAKAAAWEREAGLHGFAKRPMREPGAEFGKMTMWNGENGDEAWRAKNPNTPRANVHPTVKPIRLAEYLARLILPPELDTPRRLLVPFAGSGSEMIGARLAGWDVVTGIERESEYVALAEARLAWWAQFASYDDARAAYEKERKAKPALVVIEDKPEQIALFPADEEAS